MNLNIALFILFAASAVTLKLISAWMPIDIMIALSLWTGLQIKTSPRIFQKVSLALMLVGSFILADYLFAIIYSQRFFYPGFCSNHMALASGAVLALLTPKNFHRRALGIFGISSAMILFFVLSNLSVFFFTPLYPQTLSGLSACFIAALPFLKTQWISNGVGFASMILCERKLFSKIFVKQNA